MTRTVLMVLAFAAGSLSAQERATTASGRVVLLYPDGTWKNLPATESAKGSGRVRSAAASAKLDLARGKAALYYDPTKWQIGKADEPNRSALFTSTATAMPSLSPSASR